MCELFGVCSKNKIQVNQLLREFFSHSDQHPHGWGMAIFHDEVASIEKEPVTAAKSSYLRERLRHAIEVNHMIGHIRLATMGTTEYANCHPFVKKDCFGRRWTLAHNGTLFNGYDTEKYRKDQEGQTDSERILYYIVEQINKEQEKQGHPLKATERFLLLEKLICSIAEGNKLNLLIYDGEFMYVHTNYKDSLFYLQNEKVIIFSTTPLDQRNWMNVPFRRLMAYKDGEVQFSGVDHGKEYYFKEEDYRYLLMESAAL